MSVIIGMDPHKRSATIEVINERAVVLATGRYGTDKAGYAQMLAAAGKFADRVWAGRAATASAGTWRTAWSMTGRSSPACRRGYPRRCGCSPPVTAARPIRSTRTQSRWSRCDT